MPLRRHGLISAANFVRRDTAVEFLRQTTDYRPGRHHLAVDHVKQLHRVDAQLRPQLVEVGVPGYAGSTDVLGKRVDLWLGQAAV
jgi:hypothetical protein